MQGEETERRTLSSPSVSGDNQWGEHCHLPVMGADVQHSRGVIPVLENTESSEGKYSLPNDLSTLTLTTSSEGNLADDLGVQ